MNRVDPDEYAIDRLELTAHRVEDIVLIDHWFRIDAGIGERREDRLEPAGICRGAAARCFVAPPQDSDTAEASCRLRHAADGRPNGDVAGRDVVRKGLLARAAMSERSQIF